MRTLRVVVLTWFVTDCGTALGWFIGKQLGRQEFFLGGTVLGTLSILLSIRLLVHLGWFNGERRRGGSLGALCAFALAAPIAAMNMDTPLIPLTVMALVGLGVIAGAGPSAAL